MDTATGTPDRQREQEEQHDDEAAAELERAAQHLRIAARHYRDAEVPHGCAHAFAAIGHISNGNRLTYRC